MQFTIDGNSNLQEQENTINFAENTASIKLVSYVRAIQPPAPPSGTGSGLPPAGNPHSNLATFESVDQTVVLPPVKLLELPSGQTIGNILNQHPGKQLIFVSDVWVGGVINKIIGMR
jgi:hypothetical protein